MSDGYEDDDEDYKPDGYKPKEDGIKQRIYDKKLYLYKSLVIELERAPSKKDPNQISLYKSHIALLDGLL